MSKFNETKKIVHEKTYGGSRKFEMNNIKEELLNIVATSLFAGDMFYESSDSRLKRLKELINKCDDHEYIAKLAVYARKVLNLRTVPLILLIELTKIHNGDNLVRKAVRSTITRADELTEILAAYKALSDNNKQSNKLSAISSQLKKGIADSFHKFDLYNFQKYKASKKEIKLRDVLFLTHPKPKDEIETELFKKIADDTLGVPYTWETRLSNEGQKECPNMKACWEEIIDMPLNTGIIDGNIYYEKKNDSLVRCNDKSKELNFKKYMDDNILRFSYGHKLPIMAMMRNIRNIILANVSESHHMKMIKALVDEKTILNSKLLPFRYLSAYFELNKLKLNNSAPEYILNMYSAALEEASKISARNISFDSNEKILIVSDVSASMYRRISKNSDVTLYHICLLLSMLYKYKCPNSDAAIFGDTFEYIDFDNNVTSLGYLNLRYFKSSENMFNLNKILENVIFLESIEGCVGYSTNIHLLLDDIVKNKREYDRILIFTDCQFTYEGNIQKLINKYIKDVNKNSKFYFFDLAGYGKMPVKCSDSVYMISGFSDKMFTSFDMIDNIKSLVTEVENVELQ